MIQNICHLMASREHGDLEKHVADLSRWQAHHSGARVSVIGHPRFQTTLDEAVRFIPLNTDRNRHHPNLTWRLANQIRAGAFQLVHGHGSKSAQLLAAVQQYTDTLQIITRHNVRHPRDKLASAFDARIAISRAAVANSRLNWHIIPNGVDAATIPSPAAKYMNRPPQILVVARLVKVECLDRLLQAMQLLPDTQLTVIGDGPEKENLQKTAEALQLVQRVQIAGNLAPERRRALMRSADLLISCSHADGSWYTAVEALLQGCPVLSGPIGDIGDYLPADYLLHSTEPSHMAERLDQILENRARLQTDFEPVFARATRELTLEHMAKETWRVYADLVERQAERQSDVSVMPTDTNPRRQSASVLLSPRD
ncbi:glycosyltransferase family 4 protein [Microbulbifer hainanensis]|uniref:glycosyltransferase family 4 protein n=1 Tax=Microbulbifer hainanensis TaxID=2735675 RepID=UPI0018679C2C|nr:glycosyltransferase family 4 protein [Microbulbifer hainanensis]